MNKLSRQRPYSKERRDIGTGTVSHFVQNRDMGPVPLSQKRGDGFDYYV